MRNTRNKTTKYLKNKGNETSKFLKKKRNQTKNFFKKKKQNITQKVGNLRKRLFGKKNNVYIDSVTGPNETPHHIPSTQLSVRGSKFNSNKKSGNLSRQIENHNKKFPLFYNYYGYIDRE